MALPAGRRGLRADLVTFDGLLKNGSGGSEPTITTLATPEDESVANCNIKLIEYDKFCIVSGVFTVASTVTNGWKRIVRVPNSKDMVVFAGFTGYNNSGKRQACDMNIELDSNGFIKAYLNSYHTDTWYTFTCVYEKES